MNALEKNYWQKEGVFDVTFEALECFAAIAQGGTFLNVAEDFNLSQSALSKIIKKLEEELGAELFDRSGRSVKLTHAGRQLLKDYLDMEPYYNTMKLHMKEMSSKFRIKVYLGMPGGALNLSNILEAFMTDYPQIPIQIMEKKGDWIKTARDAMRMSESTAVIVHRTFQCDKDSYVTLMKEDPLMCFLPQDHPLAAKEQIMLDDILPEKIFANGWTRDILNELSKTYHVAFKNIREVEKQHRESVLWNVSSRKGITLLYKSDIKDISVGRVVARMISGIAKPPVILYLNAGAKEKQSFTVLRNYLVQAVNKELVAERALITPVI